MTIENVHEEDSLVVDVSITENGEAKDLTGATVAAAVRSPHGDATAVDASILNAANGVVRASIPKDVLNVPGSWALQCRVELGIESRTVYTEDVIVQPSLIKDAM